SGWVSHWFSTAGGRELVAQSTPSCSFNFVPDRPTGSWPANQTPRINVTRKHTRSHGQAWLVTRMASAPAVVSRQRDGRFAGGRFQPGGKGHVVSLPGQGVGASTGSFPAFAPEMGRPL